MKDVEIWGSFKESHCFLQVAKSSAQASDRVSHSLLGSLMKSAELSLSAGSDRSAVDFSMAIMSTIVKASQAAHAAEFHASAITLPHNDSRPRVEHLSLQSSPQEISSAGTEHSQAPGILAGKGPELLHLAERSAASCTEQHASMSNLASREVKSGVAELQSSSNDQEEHPSLVYPLHELEVRPDVSLSSYVSVMHV